MSKPKKRKKGKSQKKSETSETSEIIRKKAKKEESEDDEKGQNEKKEHVDSETSWSCRSDGDDQKIDWFVILKPPNLNKKVNGKWYYYYDSQMWANGIRSTKKCDDITSDKTALYHIFNQLDELDTENYENRKSIEIFFNDQIGKKSYSNFGHMKGALCYYGTSGFFLTHSVPNYIEEVIFNDFAENGIKKGQHFFCFTIDKDGLDVIAEHLFMSKPKFITSPNAKYMSSPKDSKFINSPYIHQSFTEKSVFLHHINQKVFETKAYKKELKLETPGNLAITIFSKTFKLRQNLWHDVAEKYKPRDFLVSTFWDERTQVKKHHPGLKVVTVTQLKSGSRSFWNYTQDHSKYAFAQNINCFADINYVNINTLRSGGIYCFENELLYEAVTEKLTFTTPYKFKV